jgi:hypothetical protein
MCGLGSFLPDSASLRALLFRLARSASANFLILDHSFLGANARQPLNPAQGIAIMICLSKAQRNALFRLFQRGFPSWVTSFRQNSITRENRVTHARGLPCRP